MGLSSDAALYLIGVPMWLAVLIYLIRTAKDWPGIMDKYNERQRDKAQIEGQKIARWDDRMRRLEEREEECQRQLNELMQWRATMRGYSDGRGQASQDAQMIVSSERQKDAKAKEGKES